MRNEGIQNDAALARAAGLDASLISNWRSGKQQPSRRSLKRLAAALRTTPVNLYLVAGIDEREDLELGDAQEPTTWPRQFRELRDVYEAMAAAGRGDRVLEAIETLVLGLQAQLSQVDQSRTTHPSGRRRTA